MRHASTARWSFDRLLCLAALATAFGFVPSTVSADNFLPPGDFTSRIPPGWLSDVALSHEPADGLPPGSARLDGESDGFAMLLSPCIDLSTVPLGTPLELSADLQPVNYDVVDVPVGAVFQIRFYQDSDCDLGWTSYTAFLGAMPQGDWSSLTASNPYSGDRRFARAVVGVSQQVPTGGVTLVDNVELDAVGVAVTSPLEVPALSVRGSILLVLLLAVAAVAALRSRVA